MSGGISVRLLLAEDEKELSNALVVILNTVIIPLTLFITDKTPLIT